MGINVKNDAVEAAIRRLAAERRVDLTEAIRLAVEAELERGSQAKHGRLRRMRAVADRVAALPLLDQRGDEEILGYDESGLPA
jgi:antitoxin VapB